MKEMGKGFTLIELLITIGVVAVLASIAFVVLNPPELLRQARDADRVVGLATLNKAIDVVRADAHTGVLGAPLTIYVSIPDPTITSGRRVCDAGLGLPNHPGWTYSCVGSADLLKSDGNGWIPINFTVIPGISLSALPIDPLNTVDPSNPAKNFFYLYATDGEGNYELNAKTESQKFGGGS